LAWYQWQCESARDSFAYDSSQPHVIYSDWQPSDLDVTSYLHYDVFDKFYAKLDAVIGIMNEQFKHFVSEIRKCGVLHGTDPSLSFPRLWASSYDDCESFIPLESNLVDDTPSTDPEEALDPPLTSSSLVAPPSASTPIGTTVSALTFLAYPNPLAQCTRLETDKHSRGEASFIEDAMID